MMKYWKIVLLLAVVLLLFLIGGGSGYRYLGGAHSLDVVGEASMHGGDLDLPGSGWSNYGNDAGGHRFSSAAQITADNVADLEMAWQFSTDDLQTKQSAIGRSIAEATPILADDVLVFCTPFNDVIALDPATGEQRWRFNAGINLDQQPGNQFVCRGVAHWQDDRG